jgi:hypothetical protein
MTGKGRKLTTSLVLLVFGDDNASVESSACISFTPAQVYSLIRIYLGATSLWNRKCLPIDISL